MIPLAPCAIFSSRLTHKACTCVSICSRSLEAYSTMLIPKIGLFGSSVIKSDTECQMMSCFAKFNTLESTVSTDKALAFNIIGAERSAASNELYLMLISVRYFGIGRRLSFASQIKASEPSEPVRIRVRLNSLSSLLKTFFKS